MKKYSLLVIVCLLALLSLVASCSCPSKEFTATVTDIAVSTSDGLILSSAIITCHFDNGEVLPFSSKAGGKLQVGERYLVKCGQTYINGQWTLDSAEKVKKGE